MKTNKIFLTDKNRQNRDEKRNWGEYNIVGTI